MLSLIVILHIKLAIITFGTIQFDGMIDVSIYLVCEINP